jgi:hypothetical protein
MARWRPAYRIDLTECLWDDATAERLQALRDDMGNTPARMMEYGHAVGALVAAAATTPEPRYSRTPCEGAWDMGTETLLVSGLRAEAVLPCVCAYHLMVEEGEHDAKQWQMLGRAMSMTSTLLKGWANLPPGGGTPHLDVAHVNLMGEVAQMRCVLQVYTEIYVEDTALAAGIARHALSLLSESTLNGRHAASVAVTTAHTKARATLWTACRLSNAQCLKKQGAIHDACAVLAASSSVGQHRLLPEAHAHARLALLANLQDRSRVEPGTASLDPDALMLSAVDIFAMDT